MVVLENDKLKVAIKLKGAELSSVIDKQSGTEYMWQGNPDIWGYHAPNLFPVVGGLKENKLKIDGKEYNLNRHGFARTSNFRRIESTPTQAVLSLSYDDETLQIYPYKFEFELTYRLVGNQVQITYKVVNKEDKKIYFSVGGHPGFNVPLEEGEVYEDYYIQFEKEEDLVASTLSDKGLFNGSHKEILKGTKLPLKANLFDDDALVFKYINSRSVTLRNNRATKSIKLDFHKFKELGIWAKPGAPFVCIEPWLGYADNELGQNDISEKPGIQALDKGHVFEANIDITFE
ncbi:Aldose 1-epimerase [Pseudopedobacter saltans DSM 12145]|uniref:Aldose 1-epimerase n=1 Tax=Pseudopedobacter saltans (strain ATCC 51119 / DSM 12145 / JCM 21818 / CCUG 39354 / LMG 10337 / NBRC 100064 / NCIMB 13643) TaxID=762903 RepID=F0SD18_PSESL|nr:aldose 1-epimerase family protein [Pseudopedobacter saltans]ADY51775.1 Aldose 1-epimerase [Pseudopedobacter saltans DSM 12145]